MIKFSKPVFGDPRIDHATPATNGGTNSGSMPALAINPFQGVLVRTTTQANESPIATATMVPPPQAISEFVSALATFGLAATTRKLAMDKSARRYPSTTGLVVVSAPISSIETGYSTRNASTSSNSTDHAYGSKARPFTLRAT